MSLLERANLLLWVYAALFPEPSCYPQSATHQFELGTVNRSWSLCIRQWCSFSGPKRQSKPAGECLQVSYVVLEISRFLQKVFQSICIRFQCWIVLKPPNSLRENASNPILKCLSWLPPLHMSSDHRMVLLWLNWILFRGNLSQKMLSKSISTSVYPSELVTSLKTALNKILWNTLNAGFGPSVLMVLSTDLFLKSHTTC